MYFEHQNTSSNISFKLKALKEEGTNEILLDESYFSFLYKNNVFSIGRIDRWWSPSDSSSLILSNSARPTFGIDISNYVPILFENSLLNKIGMINYSIFLNKLEKERHIPNALIFGNRLSVQPSNKLNISFRVAQFSGDGHQRIAKQF